MNPAMLRLLATFLFLMLGACAASADPLDAATAEVQDHGPDIGSPFACPPLGTNIYTHWPYVAVAVYYECLPIHP